MKNKGFTLAEVLITLAIIGVVAAITLPSFLSDTTAAQIGPKLSKAVSAFEQANEALLAASSVDLLTDTDVFPADSNGSVDLTSYGEELSNHLKITEFTYPENGYNAIDNSEEDSCEVGASFDEAKAFLSKDGIMYLINKDQAPSDPSAAPHKQRIGNVYIDINGVSTPNEMGTDIFVFTWWNDGSLRPVGAQNWNGLSTAPTWRTLCPANDIPTDYKACAGHVFENNLKVSYK
ncbi:MAG: type II secretion system protein [Cyanobacteria bacterium SIG31]|nr:type II secretion system protein [Cyanobacteria bacterium SIG31]